MTKRYSVTDGSSAVGDAPGERVYVGRRRASRVAAIAVCVWMSSAHVTAWAQNDARGQPVLRTPRPQVRPGVPAAPAQPLQQGNAPGGAAQPPTQPTQGAAPATNAPGGKPADPNDPMSKVTQGPQEIEFQPKPAGYEVSFNLDDADLPELVKAISNITGRRFIYGGKLRSIKATVYSPEKVTAAEAYAAFLSILETNGLTVIPHGRFLKIVETPGVVQQTTPIYGTAAPVPFEDRYVTRLYRLRHVDANEVSNVLNKFKTKDGDITVYTPGNLLIITETGSNIRRMLRIVEEVDVGSAGDQLFVHPVHYGSAEEMATKLNEILGGGAGGAGAGANILADPHTNSLIVTSTREDYERLLELLKRLDVPQSGEGTIHVLPLQHATCDDLSATLNGILGGAAAGGGAAAAGRGAAAGRAAPAGGGTGEDIFEGAVKVTCDEATNSMVTTSSLRDYAQLRKVIDELDKPRRQVFIEAVIMDINVDRQFNWGIGYHGGSDFQAAGDQGFVYGGNNPGQSILGVPARLEGLALGVRGPEIDGSNNVFAPGISIPALGVVLHALAEDGDSNVLATPHILATDNIPAEISIGQNIPLQTNVGGGNLASLAQAAGGAAGAGGLGALLGGGLGFNAPRQDVGTKISVTPHVNDSDQVRLELVQEISDAGAPTGDLGAVPINKRTAKTTLIVKDQQTVVIGGLVRDAFIVGETKIPILGDIPILGFLFKQHQRQKTKTNLLLILTPHVIRSQEDLRDIFERKMQERQEFLDRYFVFNDISDWSPPRDFNRANGLIEVVRQEQIALEERAALEQALEPDDVKTHEPTKAIQLPSIGSKAAEPAPAPARPAARPGAANPRTQAPATNRPQLRVPGRPTPAPAPAPNQKVNRVEE